MRQHISRRRFLADSVKGAAVLAISSALAACGIGSSPSQSSAKKKVGFVVPYETQVRWRAGDEPNFAQEAKRQGFEAIIQSSNNSVATQASQVENLLTQGVDVIVLTPVDIDAAAGLVKKAKAQKVPVIAYDTIINSPDIAAYVGRNTKTVGMNQAKLLVAAAPKGNYVCVFGDQGIEVGRNKAAGALEVLKPSIDSGDIKIVSQIFNRGFATELARAQVENALTANHNNIAACVTSNDGMAYGVVQAIQAQNLGGKIAVSGEDAELQALKFIQSGVMTMSAFPSFDQMAIKAAQAAGQLLAGKKIVTAKTISTGGADVPWIEVEPLYVTKSNLSDFVHKYPWWADPAQLGL